VCQRFLAIEAVVQPPQRERIPHTGCGQSFKAEVSQQASTANIPGVRNDENRLAFMKRAKGLPLVQLTRLRKLGYTAPSVVQASQLKGSKGLGFCACGVRGITSVVPTTPRRAIQPYRTLH